MNPRVIMHIKLQWRIVDFVRGTRSSLGDLSSCIVFALWQCNNDERAAKRHRLHARKHR